MREDYVKLPHTEDPIESLAYRQLCEIIGEALERFRGAPMELRQELFWLVHKNARKRTLVNVTRTIRDVARLIKDNTCK